MIGLSLSDLGISTDSPVAPAPNTKNPRNRNLFATPKCGEDSILVNQSVFSKLVYQTWSGTPCVILDSPPGAGKTTTVVELVGTLALKADLRVAVLTPTNRGGNDIIERIDKRWGFGASKPGSSNLRATTDLEGPFDEDGETIHYAGDNPITVRTVASAAMNGMSRYNYDVVVVDEAYQSTYSNVVCALSSTEIQSAFDDDGEEVETTVDTSIDQVVLIGDPEQIGPVVLDAENPLLTDGPFNVTDPAPEVFSLFPDTVRMSLPSSYRLGSDTTSVVKKFYDFDFDSRRPDMNISGLEEVNTMPIEMDGRTDVDMARTIAAEINACIGSDFTYVDVEGEEHTRPLQGSDVAVVAAHNDQVALLSSMILPADPTVTVGTADSLQGGQWPLVFALDPLSGVDSPSDHHFSLGRLCVMLSRHMSSLVWVYEKNWKSKVAEFVEDDDEASLHRRVRKSLVSVSMEF